MKLIVAPVPNRTPITLEGETQVIQKATRVQESRYYLRHIEAGNLAVVSDLDEVVEEPASVAASAAPTEGEDDSANAPTDTSSDEDIK